MQSSVIQHEWAKEVGRAGTAAFGHENSGTVAQRREFFLTSIREFPQQLLSCHELIGLRAGRAMLLAGWYGIFVQVHV